MIRFTSKESPPVEADARQTLCSIESRVEESLKEFEKTLSHHQRHLTDRSRNLHEDNQHFIKAARDYCHLLEVAGALRSISETGLPASAETAKLPYSLLTALLDHQNREPETADLVPVAQFISRHRRQLENTLQILWQAESAKGNRNQYWRTIRHTMPGNDEEEHWR